jgi:type VI protein secretion system component VasF
MSNDAWLILGLGFYVLLVARGLSKQIEGVERRLMRRLVSPEERRQLDEQELADIEWRKGVRKKWWVFARNAFLVLVCVFVLVWIFATRQAQTPNKMQQQSGELPPPKFESVPLPPGIVPPPQGR